MRCDFNSKVPKVRMLELRQRVMRSNFQGGRSCGAIIAVQCGQVVVVVWADILIMDLMILRWQKMNSGPRAVKGTSPSPFAGHSSEVFYSIEDYHDSQVASL